MTDDGVERAALLLFEAMLDVAEAERDAWIAEQTEEDPRLASRLAAMREGDRLARLQTGAAIDELDEEAPPERIGAYRVAERIGRGGMGSVYRGERVTGDFAHVAAIKIIKPGLLSDALVERFQRERQILARLVHPNIAQLYDGGETEGGSPYIVMEHVDGMPLLPWIDAHDADRTERLRLFGAIGGAVAFANRNLVVHRDLTPSNVLVTADGAVKLIDFGISKPVDAQAPSGERTSASIGSLSLTPGYAAPERMISTQVSTAADIYSLGKLLEKILPPAPGDRELRAILARATATDPLARYASADALGADVDAWHRNRPVQALPQSRSYIARKFVARNRVAVSVAAAVLLLLVGALAVTLNAYGRAERARQAEAARFGELRSLARYMIFDLNGALARVAGNTQARVALTDRAQRYLGALAASTSADDALRREAALGFVTLAHAQGVPGQPNLGQRERATENLTRALAMLRASSAPAAATAPSIAIALTGDAMLRANVANRIDLAKKDLTEAEKLLNAVPAAQRETDWHGARSVLRRTQLEIATLENDAPALARISRQLESEPAQWPAPVRHGYRATLDRAYALYYRATGDYFSDRLADGLSANRQAEALFAALDQERPDDPVILYARAWNAYVGYGNASEIPAAAAESRRFVALAGGLLSRLVAMEANDNALRSFASTVRQIEAQSLADQGRYAQAVAIQRDVIAMYAKALAREPGKPTMINRMALAEIAMGAIARAAGDRPLLCDSYRSAQTRMVALERRKELLGFVAGHKAEMADTLKGCPP